MTRMTEKGVYPASVYDHFLANGYWSKVFTEAAGVTDPAKKIEVIRNSAAAVKISIVQSEKIYDLWQDAREVQQNNAELLAYADKLYAEWLTGDHDPENLIKTAFPQIIGAGNQNPNQPPVTPPPQPGEFAEVHTIDQCAFVVKKVKGELCCGTYGQLGAVNTAKWINFATKTEKVYDNETVYDICYHKGNWFTSHETGSDGHGKIRLAGTDQVVWTAPYDIILGLTSSNDGHLYVSCLDFAGRFQPKMFRSLDGLTGWGEYCALPMGTVPTSHCVHGGNLWTAAGNAGVVWGGNSLPTVICNKNVVFQDSKLKGFGFYGRPCSFRGDLYLPLCGSYSGVYSYNRKEVVLRVNDCEACTWIGTDGVKLYALFSNGFINDFDSKAKCCISPEVQTWETKMLDMKIAFAGSFEDDGFYVAGGDNWCDSNRSGKICRLDK